MTTARARVPSHNLVSAATAAAGAWVAALGALSIRAGYGVEATALAGVSITLLVLPRISRTAGLARGYFSIEIPIALLLLSTLVFRVRHAEALAQNPLDSAALIRLLCVGAAALLGWLALLREPMSVERVAMPPAVLAYTLYVGVVFLGAPLSSDLPLTAYRGIELAVGLLVVVAAIRFGGPDAIRRIERTIYAFLILMVGSVWLGVVLFPGQAIYGDVEPIPVQIAGVYPAVASNGVGTLGALLLVWSLGLRVAHRAGGRWNAALIVLGAVTLLASQYRTGYLGVAVVVTLLLATRGRRVLTLLALASVLVIGVWTGSAILRATEPYVLRGQSREQAQELSGRMSYWSHAVPVWRESPLLGKGLLTATRFEVLAPLGGTGVSTIHGTWVEVLVGTGLLGLSLLLAAFLLLWRSALGDLRSPTGFVYPALVLAFVTVRSVTGTTFEAFGFETLLVLTLAFRLAIGHRWELPRA